MPSPPGVVILGGYSTALTAVRALAPAVGPIALISMRADDIAQHSRWVDETVYLWQFPKNPEALLALLEEKASDWGGRTGGLECRLLLNGSVTVLAGNLDSIGILSIQPLTSTVGVPRKMAVHTVHASF